MNKEISTYFLLTSIQLIYDEQEHIVEIGLLSPPFSGFNTSFLRERTKVIL